jgi:hypothetical protein
MNDSLTNNEIKEEESKSNTNEIDNIINNKNKNDSIYYSNNNINMYENEINNNIENNIEHDIGENNMDYNNININQDNINNNNHFDNINENNNYNYNQNNINTERNENNNDLNNKEIIKEKDIIDELIEKIRNNQDLNISKEYKKRTFADLDEELKLGLESLNSIKTGSNRKTILDTQNELERKSFERNKKYNEVISELTKPVKQLSINKIQYKPGSYFDYKNIQIIKPNYYFQTERRNEPIYELPSKNQNKFYMSSIDGKIIVNGERKYLDKNFYKNDRQCFSNNKRKNIANNYNFPDFGMRKLNFYNKNYFADELKKMNKFLFN